MRISLYAFIWGSSFRIFAARGNQGRRTSHRANLHVGRGNVQRRRRDIHKVLPIQLDSCLDPRIIPLGLGHVSPPPSPPRSRHQGSSLNSSQRRRSDRCAGAQAARRPER